MKKRGIALAVFLLLLALGTAGAADNTGAAPKIVVPEGSFTFDPMIEGSSVVHDFVIRNTGNAELKISQVRTG